MVYIEARIYLTENPLEFKNSNGLTIPFQKNHYKRKRMIHWNTERNYYRTLNKLSILDVTGDLKKLWNMGMRVVPVVVGLLGMMPKTSRKC